MKFGEATVKALLLDTRRKSWGSVLGSWERTEEGRRREGEQTDEEGSGQGEREGEGKQR